MKQGRAILGRPHLWTTESVVRADQLDSVVAFEWKNGFIIQRLPPNRRTWTQGV